MVFCPSCGRQNFSSATHCSECGSVISKTSSTNNNSTAPNYNQPPPNYNQPPPNYYQRPPEWKSEGITLVLTIILGICGLGGIGHIYLGLIGKGIVILIVGIILLVVTFFTLGIGLIVLIPFAIWVVFDSRKQCKYYNDHLQRTGRPPW